MSMNPFCEIAVEEELWLHEAGAASEDVAATVNPAQAADMLRTTLAMGADRDVHVLHDPDPARPLLPLAIAKILRALALQETPGLLILGKKVLRVLPPGEVAHRSARGFVSEDEFLSIPEFSTNPLSQRLLRMVDGLNFKEFVSFLSTFSARASLQQKIELIFKVYDIDGKGKVSFKDLV